MSTSAVLDSQMFPQLYLIIKVKIYRALPVTEATEEELSFSCLKCLKTW